MSSATSLRAFRYALPLQRPLRMPQGTMAAREGLLLCQDDEWADVAPLPGYSRDDLPAALRALRHGTPAPPALTFALEALQTPWRACEVPINALLWGDASQVLQMARTFADTDATAVKLKVGRDSDLDAEVRLVHSVREVLAATQTLRVDANRAWDLRQACRFAERVGDCVEFIEEPTRDPGDLEGFFAATGVPYALDETVYEQQDLSGFPSAHALVVKPTCAGGLDRLQELAALGPKLLLSGCFESGVGIGRIAQWAHRLGTTEALGLDTYSWLAQDVLQEPLIISGGRLIVPDTGSIDLALCEEVPL